MFSLINWYSGELSIYIGGLSDQSIKKKSSVKWNNCLMNVES